MVFSFGELGFQEVETSRYLTGILEQHGFTVRRGYAGMPTAWVATWGSGKPVIAIGSDIDGIPKASQKPGVAYRDPMIAGIVANWARGASADRAAALGLQPDAPPVSQYARADRHREVVQDLLARGRAYRCYMSVEELEVSVAHLSPAGTLVLRRRPFERALGVVTGRGGRDASRAA